MQTRRAPAAHQKQRAVCGGFAQPPAVDLAPYRAFLHELATASGDFIRPEKIAFEACITGTGADAALDLTLR